MRFEHQVAIEYVLGVLTSKKHGAIEAIEEINAVDIAWSMAGKF